MGGGGWCLEVVSGGGTVVGCVGYERKTERGLYGEVRNEMGQGEMT
jgi:hypothetical protein